MNPTTPPPTHDGPLSASEIASLYREKKASPSEVVERLLHWQKVWEPSIHALVGFDPDWVRQQAKDLERAGWNGSPLWGIPVLIKDNICVRGIPTTCASNILKGFRPPYDATVIARLRAAGAILWGMANMDEFAFGSSCEHSSYGPTRNPWALDRVPGGSSGGSAAALACGMVPLALGSDTGGSIRQPASFCGVVGLKPTYGRVSRYGLVAFASSLDQIGPMARTIQDLAELLKVIAGFDPNDSTSARIAVPHYSDWIRRGVKGIRLGVPKEYLTEGIDGTVRMAIEKALTHLACLGAKIEEVSMPHTEFAIPTYYIIATAEASSNLARFDGVRFGHRTLLPQGTALEMYLHTRAEGFGPEAKRRIILGTFVLSKGYYEAYYGRALRVRTLIVRDFEEAFKRVDALITPTAPTPAFRLGEKLEDPLMMYLSDILTISANLAGVPALAIPCGFTDDGLPIGMQLMTRPFQEEILFQVAGAYEETTEWHKRYPPIP